ncbi:MAG: hypothetical protein AB8B53_02515 [Flavobacteriales bacterium]
MTLNTSSLHGFVAVLISVATLSLNLDAQTIDTQIQETMDMRSIGPAGMSGRVTAIDAETENPEVIYIGTASGGVWKSVSGGITWKPIFDDNPVLGIGALAINQNNTDEVWVGTGEGNPRNSHTSGGGIYKSRDAGQTWEMNGLEATKNIHRVIINEQNSDVVFACAMGSIWGPNPERGVYRTKDGGDTWENILFVNDSVGCAELIQDPTNPKKLFAAMWEYGRKPWTFNSGGAGSGLYVTYDGGDNWKLLDTENGLPQGPLGRMGLAMSAANPDVVYALIESAKTGLYKSTDGGVNWNLVSTENIGNRPFYYAEIHADPQNENVLFNLWSYFSKSIDGGKAFKIIMDYPAYHPDHHAFYIHPKNSDFMIEGNDGGLNITRDGGESWGFVRNLPLAQFYHINVDDETPYNIYGGMQDNGSWKGPGFVWHVDGIRNEDWQEILFGDGFDVVPVPGSDGLAYAMYQGGAVNRINTHTGKKLNIQPVHPDGETLRYNWNGAISIDPHNSKAVYIGSQFLHYSTDMGSSWKLLSEDLTTNDSLKQKQAESGGLTLDATQAENFTTITCITPSELKPDEIWVGTDDGRIHYTTDKGENWNEVSIKGMPKGAWVAQIETSPVKEGEVFIAVNDYRRNNYESYLFHSKDYGKKWQNIAADESVNGYVHCIVQDKVQPELLFMGTEHGLYVSLDRGFDWTQWTENFPSVSVIDLKIQERFGDLIIGTFGRAAYILDDITPLRELALQRQTEFTSEFTLFKPQQAYKSTFSRPRGERFRADHYFSGKNKHNGAKFFYHLQLNDSLEKEDQKIHVAILNAEGDSLRHFKVEAKDGFNEFMWRLDAKGVRFPSRTIVKKDEDEPGGGFLAPGIYKVAASYDGLNSETSIEVLSDPRMDFNIPENYAIGMRRVTKLIEEASATFEKLQRARKSLLLSQQLLEAYPEDTSLVQLLDSSKTLVKRIDKLEEWYMSPRDEVGYEHVTVRLNSMLYDAYGLVRNPELMYEEGSNSFYALQNARERYEEAKVEIDDFLIQEYTPFRKEFEALSLSPFKD